MVVGLLTSIVIILFVLAALLIPVRWRVKETADLNISLFDSYESLLNLKNWPRWQMDENTAIPFMYVGPERGEGASQYWEIEGVPASLKISRCVPGISIHYQMRINKGETVLRFVIFFSENHGCSTTLTWVCEGTTKKNPFERYLTFYYKWKMGQEMKAALFRLKKIYEPQSIELKQPA
ncbi:hypothetical protein [Fictibacillus arsenicus]|uniref:Polyketide cyclase n=1 Tax=Fictibacillus arsenicus TaxID=255247 RepID=A0A1V3GEH2_9BACL|nr:hypothetical protein [Fictibacillus arsenicus]OOE14801.1 hypothetical protein UN64_06340 [Fictibacillus arsenicus]